MVPQVALRDCSEDAGVKVSIHLILAKGEIQSRTCTEVSASLMKLFASDEKQSSP